MRHCQHLKKMVVITAPFWRQFCVPWFSSDIRADRLDLMLENCEHPPDGVYAKRAGHPRTANPGAQLAAIGELA